MLVRALRLPITLAVLLAAASPAALPTAALGRAGEPDPSFGTNGYTILDEPEQTNEQLSDVVILPNEKILAAGRRGPSTGFLLARFNSDGTPDQSFGNGGIRVNPDNGEPGDPRAIEALALRGDGRIVAAGVSRGPGGESAFGFARYGADGLLDPEFGNGGLATIPVGALGEALAVDLAPDGKVVAAGEAEGKAAIVRLRENGLPDTEFSALPAGVRFIDVPGPGEHAAAAVRALPSGAVVIGGFSPRGPFLAELDRGGNPVAGFGTNGVETYALGSGGEHAGAIEDLRVLPDGRILAAGGAEAGLTDTEFFVARFTPSGKLDTSFGEGGVTRLNPTPGTDEALALSVLPDGRILTAGRRGQQEEGVGDTWLVRLTPDGRLDPSFGSGGEAVASAVPDVDLAAGLALEPDGRAVVAGKATDGGEKLLVGRFTADPEPASAPGAARCAGRRATMVGTPGADRLTGTGHADVIAALGGNDRISALGGNDVVCGGAGRDQVRGGKGNDRLRGEGGPDTLRGGPGKDLLLGEAGADRLLGGPGRRDLCGGGGRHDVRGQGCERPKTLP